MAVLSLASIDIPDSTIESFQLIVTVWDYLHNEARDTSEVITVFDNTTPTIEIISPTSGFTIPENTELTTTWNATDNISVDSITVYYSNDGGNWKKSNIKIENQRLKINFDEKFLPRRGRVNCSLNDNGKWRWFGIQFPIKTN